MWWGVDSSGPMTDAGLSAIKAWYRGATPQVWGRYLDGHYAVSATELQWARAHGIYVDLLVPDHNCSQCAGGGDICENDETAAQAAADARDALAAAKQLPVPRGAILFKDVEQVSSCIGEPTAAYVDAWYRAARDSGYRVGMYGNSTNAGFAFARSYCQVIATDHRFATEVLLDATEPEPNLGLPAGVDGPTRAPAFHPDLPPCAKGSSTTIWQYGESVDRDNYADIDQIRPHTPGLLAPDGSVTQ